jgi:hypothetical protein
MTVLVMLLALPALSAFAAEGSRGSTPTLNTKDTGYRGVWKMRPITTSGNNYDTGSLYLEPDGTWRVIAPTDLGSQPYNPGGEMTVWASDDQGATWKKGKPLTSGSLLNHNYARRPVDAQDGFYAFWADGHGRQPSASSLYFCNKTGDVYRLPPRMTEEFARPERIHAQNQN